MKINFLFTLIFSSFASIQILTLVVIEKLLIPQFGCDFRISSDMKISTWALIVLFSFFVYGFIMPKNQEIKVSLATLISASFVSSLFGLISYEVYGNLFIKYFNQENIFEMVIGCVCFYLLPSIAIGLIAFLLANFIRKFFDKVDGLYYER